MAKVNELLAAVKALKPRKYKTWFDSLTKEQQANLCDIRDKWQSGELLADKRGIHTALKDKISLPSEGVFREWMNEK